RSEWTENALVAKTGTLNHAKALAGFVSTKEGRYYFAVFFKIETSSDFVVAIAARDRIVKSLIQEHGGKEDLGVESRLFFTVDQDSVFTVGNIQMKKQ
ncbi:MAG: D-alanyl-D-alanine carboxypeptidase, partial [Pseudobdellovibrionaceae bacterium]